MSEHATNGAGGIFTELYFPPDHLHLLSIKTEHWPFSLKKKKKKERKKKAQYACAHTPVTLCTIKKWGQGNERIEKTIL